MASCKNQANKKNKVNKYDLLYDSVKKGLKEVVRQLLAEGVPIKSKTDALNNTLLHLSIINFHDIEIVQMLIENGADIHAQNKCKQQPFDIAVEKNNEEVVSLFLSKNFITGADLPSLVLKAVKNNNENIVKLLMDYGMKNKQSALLVRAVYSALHSNNTNIHTHLLPHCAPIFASELFVKCHENAYAFFSVQNGNVEFVRELLRNNFNANVMNKEGLSLLHIACLHQHQEIVQLLLDHGADVNAKCLEYKWTITKKASMEFRWRFKEPDDLIELPLHNRTALYIALTLCNVPITRLLVSNGAKLDYEPDILYNACLAACKEIVEDLITLGVDVNEGNSDNGTPLYYCITPFHQIDCWKDDNPTKDDVKCELVEFLLSKGANANAATRGWKLTPLFAAVFQGYFKTVKVLLKYNVDIQHTDGHGNTALHIAAIGRNPEMIDILLKQNLDVNVKNKENFTPLHLAAIKGNEGITERLMENNAILQTHTIDGKTPFYYACLYQNIKVVKYFLSKNIDVNIKDNKGRTALHALAQNKLKIKSTPEAVTEVAEILLDNKADIFVEDEEGMTPIFKACARKNMTMLEVLLKYITNRYPLHNLVDRVKKVYNDDDDDVLIKLENTSDRSELMEILPEDFFTKVFFTNKENQTLVHTAVKNCFTEAIELLVVQYKINVNWQDDSKKTALHVAVDNPSQSVIASLLEFGADINIKDKFDKTPVEYVISIVNDTRKLSQNGEHSDHEEWYDDEDSYNDEEYYINEEWTSDDDWYDEKRNNEPNFEENNEYLCCNHARYEMVEILKRHVSELNAANSYVSKSNLEIFSLE